MSFLSDLFGGGNKSKSSSSSRTRDEKSVQADINRALKESGGKWTSGLNDLVAERDRARSGATTSSGGRSSLSQGLGSFGNAVRSIPGNIARDVRMGTSAGLFANRERQAANLAEKGYSQRDIEDYFARTDATRARMDAEMAARQNDGPSGAQRATQQAQEVAAEVEQGPRYRNPFGQNALTIMPQRGEVTPDMRREALRIFESQRGAGQVPYQMLPYQQGLGSMRRPNMPQMPRFQPMPQPRMPQQNVSPAFQYAAQNYNRLGGSQRLMDRPMEMMSVAERQRINQMAQGMADRQRPTLFPGKGMQRPTTSPGKGAAQQAMFSTMLSRLGPTLSRSGIGSLYGSGRAMY